MCARARGHFGRSRGRRAPPMADKPCQSLFFFFFRMLFVSFLPFGFQVFFFSGIRFVFPFFFLRGDVLFLFLGRFAFFFWNASCFFFFFFIGVDNFVSFFFAMLFVCFWDYFCENQYRNAFHRNFHWHSTQRQNSSSFSKHKEAQWPIGYGVGLRIKRSSVRIRPWPLRWVLGQGSLLPLSQGEAFTLASTSYLAILVKYILAKKKKKKYCKEYN